MLSTRLARVPTFAALARRAYSDHPGPQSQGFNKKEKAHEDQYIRQKEQAELKKLMEEIQKKKAELEHLENKVDEATKEVKK